MDVMQSRDWAGSITLLSNTTCTKSTFAEELSGIHKCRVSLERIALNVINRMFLSLPMPNATRQIDCFNNPSSLGAGYLKVSQFK
ncbi:hypothetical protein NC651_025533 [Populus alba x Populus x berolinensis]|nr:hypothetical protein NC651_025533 [Populus alba x Populus x berolinensis]